MNVTGLMKKGTSTIIILVIFLLISLILIQGCTDSTDSDHLTSRTFLSNYHYGLQFSSDRPLYNVTFIIPLPVKEGVPLVGDYRLTHEDFQQPGFSATLTQFPPGLNLTGAVPLQGYQPWFVVICADSMIPANKSGELYILQKDVFVRYNNITNYRIIPNPLGSESLGTLS